MVGIAVVLGLLSGQVAQSAPPVPGRHQSAAAVSGNAGKHWIATWTAASVADSPSPVGPTSRPVFASGNHTLRQVVHISVGGTTLRVILSNTFGTMPLRIDAAHLAIRAKDAAFVPGSGRPLTFGGRPTTTIPSGAIMVSDPVNLEVSAFADLVIDVYLPDDQTKTTSPITNHSGARQTNYESTPGNYAGATDFPVAKAITSWFFLSGVEVMAERSVGTIVAFGDSITDGAASTVDANNRWPDYLARRLAAAGVSGFSVINAGIGGNRVMSEGGIGSTALARFDRDVLTRSGVTHVIVLEGINDIGRNRSLTVDELIGAHRQLVERAHARGITIIGGTLTPFEGTTIADYWTSNGETMRQAFNQWLRTSGVYDAVIDFEAAVRNPKQPTQMLAEYDSGDRLHPSDAGYQAMARAIDLNVFKP